MIFNKEFLKFGITGAINTVLGFAIVSFLVKSLQFSQCMSFSISSLLVSSFSFFVNSFWSFKQQVDLKKYLRFQLVSLVGLVVSMVLGKIGDIYGWHYILTTVILIAFMPPITFTAHRLFTYKTNAT